MRDTGIGKIKGEINMNTAQKWRKAHREQENRNQMLRYHRRYNNDIEYKLLALSSARICKSLKMRGAPRYYSILEYLGCTPKKFKQHIRKQFKPGMSWKKWNFQLDHIREIQSFNLFSAIEQKKAYNYKNIQPLSVADHIEKTSKYVIGLERKNRRLRYLNRQYKLSIKNRKVYK